MSHRQWRSSLLRKGSSIQCRRGSAMQFCHSYNARDVTCSRSIKMQSATSIHDCVYISLVCLNNEGLVTYYLQVVSEDAFILKSHNMSVVKQCHEGSRDNKLHDPR